MHRSRHAVARRKRVLLLRCRRRTHLPARPVLSRVLAQAQAVACWAAAAFGPLARVPRHSMPRTARNCSTQRAGTPCAGVPSGRQERARDSATSTRPPAAGPHGTGTTRAGGYARTVAPPVRCALLVRSLGVPAPPLLVQARGRGQRVGVQRHRAGNGLVQARGSARPRCVAAPAAVVAHGRHVRVADRRRRVGRAPHEELRALHRAPRHQRLLERHKLLRVLEHRYRRGPSLPLPSTVRQLQVAPKKEKNKKEFVR